MNRLRRHLKNLSPNHRINPFAELTVAAPNDQAQLENFSGSSSPIKGSAYFFGNMSTIPNTSSAAPITTITVLNTEASHQPSSIELEFVPPNEVRKLAICTSALLIV